PPHSFPTRRSSDLNTFARRLGGAETYLAIVIPALAQAGHELAMLFEMDSPPGHEPLTVNGEVWCIAEIGIHRALDELRKWRPDIIYTTSTNGLRTGQ